MNTADWTDQDWADAERCVRNAQATDKAYIAAIHQEIEKATTRFTEAGMSLTYARELAERSVVNALNEICAENFRGPKHG